MAYEETKSCQGCGAAIYPEHVQSGIAKKMNGKLLCAHCVKEEEEAKATADMMEPISFDTDDSHGTKVDMTASRIMTTEDTLGKAGGWDDNRFKRPLDPKNQNASRVRIFHSKITDGALDFMHTQINGWLDQNPDITVKFANSTIGMFEGKHTELNIFITLYY